MANLTTRSTPLRVNLDTLHSVQAERKRLYRQTEIFDAAVRDFGLPADIVSQFKKADFSKKFELKTPDLKALGVTDADLKLDGKAVNALPEATLPEREKKRALQLKLALDQLAAEIEAKRSAGLWQHNILAGELLPGGAQGLGLSVAGQQLSVDDLTHLNSSRVKEGLVLNKGNFPKNVIFNTENGQLSARIGFGASKEEMNQFVDVLAAAGCKEIKFECSKPKDLSQHGTMLETMFERIMVCGYDIKMVVSMPPFVKSPGLTRTKSNGEIEPLSSEQRQKFYEAKGMTNFWQDVASKTPQDLATRANTAECLAGIYSGLLEHHRIKFLELLAKKPELQKEFSGMAEYFIRSGQMPELVRFHNDLLQVWKGSTDPLAGVVSKLVPSMTSTQLNDALDNFFDFTVASRHHESLVLGSAGKRPDTVIIKMIAAMSNDQVKSHAAHLAKNPRLSQRDERAGMMLASVEPSKREDFVTKYLETIHEEACKKQGITPGVVTQLPVMPATTPPTTTPESVADRQKKYDEVNKAVNEAAQGLLVGARDYAQRTGQPNAVILNETHKVAADLVKDLAKKNIADTAVLYPAANISPQVQQDYTLRASQAYEASPEVAAFTANKARFTNTPLQPHVRHVVP